VTPEQITVVRANADVVLRNPERFGRRYHERLSSAAPEVGALFPDAGGQRGRLVDEVVRVAGAVGDFERFVGQARSLGARHEGYGVRPEHYAVMGGVLVETLAEVVGASFDDSAADAWRCLYLLLSELMMDGAARSLFTN
jgi:hemoglobin-like flavoprotein